MALLGLLPIFIGELRPNAGDVPPGISLLFLAMAPGAPFFFSGAKLQNPHSSHAHVGFDPSVCAAGNLTQTPLEFFSSHHFTPVFVDEYRPCSQF